MIKENPYRSSINSETGLDLGEVLICPEPKSKSSPEFEQKRKRRVHDSVAVAEAPLTVASAPVESEIEPEDADPAQMLVLPRHQGGASASQFDNRIGCIGALVVFMFVAYCLMRFPP